MGCDMPRKESKESISERIAYPRCSLQKKVNFVLQNWSARPFRTPPYPVCHTKGMIPMKERKWKSILACPSFKGKSLSTAISKLVVRLCAIMIKKSEQLTEQSSEYDKSHIAESIWRQRSTKVFGQGLAFNTFMKEVTRRGSSTARIPNIP